jgi:hypothetical protein
MIMENNPLTTTPVRKGAKSKRTPAKIAKIAELIATGLSYRGVAGAVGIDETTLHAWRRDDPEFAALVNKAEAESEEALIKLAVAGANKDGRVALMMLERRHSHTWSKKEVSEKQIQHLHAHAQVPIEVLQTLVEQRRLLDAEPVEQRSLRDAEES